MIWFGPDVRRGAYYPVVGSENFCQYEMELLSSLSIKDVYEKPKGIGNPNLSWWLPHSLDRNLLINLIYSLNTTSQPLILDIGCGTGLLGRILAEEGKNTKLISADIDPQATVKLDPINTANHQIIRADLWDMPEVYGPKLPENLTLLRRFLLDKIRNTSITHGGDFYTVYHGINIGYEDSFGEEVEQLQQLNEEILEPSSVDLVICSFMDIRKDLTTPLRDGIHPKALVYVRAVNGLTGAGDYYLEEPEDANLKTSIISFNPGRHYRTAARWRSACYLDWSMSKDSVLIDYAQLESEVIVQLRNDVNLAANPNLTTRNYPIDLEIEQLMVKIAKYGSYQGGVESAKKQLFN